MDSQESYAFAYQGLVIARVVCIQNGNRSAGLWFAWAARPDLNIGACRDVGRAFAHAERFEQICSGCFSPVLQQCS